MWVTVSLDCDIIQLVKGLAAVFTASAEQVHVDCEQHCDSPLASLWPQRAAALPQKYSRHAFEGKTVRSCT